MMRFHMLELMQIVLALDPNLVSANYDLNKGGVFTLLQVASL
jgi:hypothetical protein